MAKLPRIRHERFALEYVLNGGNATDAYRQAWAVHPFNRDRPITNPDSWRVIACQTLHRPDVSRRVEELRQKMAKKADITMDKVLSDLQEALNMARLHAKPSDMISASMAQAKLVGLLRDRIETGGVGDFDGMENVSEILEKVAQDAGPEAALALSKAFGLEQGSAANAESTVIQEPDPIDQPPPTDAVN